MPCFPGHKQHLLPGNGNTETLNGAGFASVEFKTLTALMNNYTITGFTTSDWLDLTDLNPAVGWVAYSGNTLTAFDWMHGAIMNLSFATTPTSGSFHISSDGAGGSKITWS